MKTKLYKWTVVLANVVSLTSCIVTLSHQLVLLAGIICFTDFTISHFRKQ